LNTFLAQSLTGVSTFLKEFYTSKVVTGVDFEGNYLTRFLKKSLLSSDLVIYPLFFVNS
jgi:hypothetical protein